MGVPEPSALFRRGLLDGRVVTVLAAGPMGEAAASTCSELSAETSTFGPAGAQAADPLDEDAVAGVLKAVFDGHGRLDALVVDAAGLFEAAPAGDLAPLRACADAAWVAARSVATTAMIEAEGGGKVIFVSPGPGAGPHAGAARDALENLARTLSIEWARHQVRVTTIHPGGATAADEVAALVAYLVSPAGDYFSGCLFSLGEDRG